MGAPSRASTFPANAVSVAAARRFASDIVRAYHPDLCDAVGLVVSELATNAVVHGGTAYVVDVESMSTFVRVEVTDVGPGWPLRAEVIPTGARGRGLRIVDRIADSWGIFDGAREAGKTVWFELRDHDFDAGAAP